MTNLLNCLQIFKYVLFVDARFCEDFNFSIMRFMSLDEILEDSLLRDLSFLSPLLSAIRNIDVLDHAISIKQDAMLCLLAKFRQGFQS